MQAIAASHWLDEAGAKRIDLFWRDADLMVAHVGGDGAQWSSNRVGPLGFVNPYVPDQLGGIFTTVPSVAHVLTTPPRPVEAAAEIDPLAGQGDLPGASPDASGVAAASPVLGASSVVQAGASPISVASGVAAAAPVSVGSAVAETESGSVTTAGPVTVARPVGGPSPVHLPGGGGLPVPKVHCDFVFGLGLDYACYFQQVWNGMPGNPQPLRSWQSLGGSFISPPAAVAWDDGRVDARVDVFSVGGADRAMYQRTFDGQVWTSDWVSLGGIFTSEACAVSWGPGRLDVFARGSDFTLRHRAFENGAWVTSDWQNLSDPEDSLASAPTAVSWGPNRLDVFAVRHSDGSLIHTWWDGMLWNEWESLAVAENPSLGFVSPPTVAVGGPESMDAFVIGDDGILYHFSFRTGAWSAPVALGTPFTSMPTAVAFAPDDLCLFGEANGSITGTAFDGTNWVGPAALRVGGGLPETVEAFTDLPTRFQFWLWQVKANTTRALEEDTDVVTSSITAGNWRTRTMTESLGNILDGSTRDTQAGPFTGVIVELCEHVQFSYQVVNKSDSDTTEGEVEAKLSMETAAHAAAEYALSSISKQLTSGVMAITKIEIAAFTVPVVGSILGILASWIGSELASILQSGRCDGVVALENWVGTGQQIQHSTLTPATNPDQVATVNPGTPSRDLCGPTSEYTVYWEIQKLRGL